jgi:hypothetical protein
MSAGFWYASPATHVGFALIGAGMLILAGGGRGLPMDYDELERWTRVGFERGTSAGRRMPMTDSAVMGRTSSRHDRGRA